MEFDRICAMLADCAVTDGAKAMAMTLTPDRDIDRVRRRLRQTGDAKALMILKGYPAFGRVHDIEDTVERAEKSAVLSMKELLDVAGVLTGARRLVDYYNEKGRGEAPSDSLGVLFSRLIPNRGLEERIGRSIIGEEIMADEASPALQDIRRRIRHCQSRIKELLQQYVSGPRSRELQDNIVTMRGGRYVIPVKAEYKNEVKGLIHDTSASGATVFIEPMAVVNENNELRTLQSREQHEIERILAELSAECAAVSGILLSNYRALTELAFVFAKAELSNRMRGIEPILSEHHRLCLRKARHPLIDKSKVVPTDIELGKEYDTMVITGPNTGGKTVTLKTLGLFALMTQAGLHIPCAEDSEMCLFDQILADIGDEQSIEQSLSTFSSHMVRIVSICESVNENSLVLLDELGAGTDPVEGAALAIAVIERVRARGALCAATTHYSELKAYALQTEGVVNAGCEFDVSTLRPTYRLIVGAPGKSNAFAISLRLGLPEEIIDAAKARISEENRSFERVIEELENQRIAMEKAKEEAQSMRREYESYRDSELKKLKLRLAESEKEIEKTREKAIRILEDARISADYVMGELEKVKKQKESENLGRALSSARSDIRRALKEGDDRVNPVDERREADYVLPRPLKKGDRVLLMNVGTEGTVMEEADRKGNVLVKTGMINTRTSEKNLKLLSEAAQLLSAEKKPISAVHLRSSIAQTIESRLDLRGESAEDAWHRTDLYLDDAKVCGMQSVTILHGKGSGILRSVIQKRLRTDPRVKSFRDGVYGEGDSGVTVVELK